MLNNENYQVKLNAPFEFIQLMSDEFWDAKVVLADQVSEV